jgi:hypothetical protein
MYLLYIREGVGVLRAKPQLTEAIVEPIYKGGLVTTEQQRNSQY